MFFLHFLYTSLPTFDISGRRKLLRAPPPPKVTIPPIKTKDINTAARVAETKKQGRIGLERNLKKAGLITKKKGPASIHRKLQRSSKRSKKLSKNAMRIVDTSTNLVEGYVNKIFKSVLFEFLVKMEQSPFEVEVAFLSPFLRFCTQDISQNVQRTVEDFSKYFLKT